MLASSQVECFLTLPSGNVPLWQRLQMRNLVSVYVSYGSWNNCHKLGGLTNTKIVCYTTGGQKPQLIPSGGSRGRSCPLTFMASRGCLHFLACASLFGLLGEQLHHTDLRSTITFPSPTLTPCFQLINRRITVLEPIWIIQENVPISSLLS